MTGKQVFQLRAQVRRSFVARQFKQISRFFLMAAGGIGMLSLHGVPAGVPTAEAQSLNYRPSNTVPASWVRYAQLVQYRFQVWLAADDDVAYRFHLFLENRVVNGDAPPEALIVQVWIAKDGKVQRTEFPPLRDKQATDDLHAILTQGNIGEAPPPDMLQPIHLRVALRMAS